MIRSEEVRQLEPAEEVVLLESAEEGGLGKGHLHKARPMDPQQLLFQLKL